MPDEFQVEAMAAVKNPARKGVPENYRRAKVECAGHFRDVFEGHSSLIRTASPGNDSSAMRRLLNTTVPRSISVAACRTL